jgi:hypothetical protein
VHLTPKVGAFRLLTGVRKFLVVKDILAVFGAGLLVRRTFSTQITSFSSIYLHYFQDRNNLDQLLSSPRFDKGLRVNL